MTNTEKQKADAKKMRDEANAAEMTSSPALNDDARTDGATRSKQSLPDGNRFD